MRATITYYHKLISDVMFVLIAIEIGIRLYSNMLKASLFFRMNKDL